MSDKSTKAIKQPVSGKVAKTPVIMQMEALECGAACLTMILSYYDKWIPLEQVRVDCGVSRDGSNARNVLAAARNYGLEAAGYKMEPEDLRKEGVFPAIIHWNFNHFVVLNGFSGDKACINDPGRGSVKIPMEEFDESFTGICLMFEPSPSFKPEGKPKSVIEFAKRRLKGTAVAVVFVVLTTIISSLMGIIDPVFSRIFYDRLLTGKNPEWVMPFIAALALFSLIQLVVAWVNTVYNLKISGKFSIVGDSGFMWKLMHLPMEFFSQRMAGDLQMRKNSNAFVAQEIVNTVAPLAINTAMMFFYLFVMIHNSIPLTILGFMSIIVDIIMAKIMTGKRTNLMRVQMRDSGKLAGQTVAGIEMIESIKAGGAENGFFKKWSGYQASVNLQSVKYNQLNNYYGIIPAIISQIIDSLIMVGGVYLTIKGKFTLGLITAFQGYLSSFLSPASTLISAGQTIQQMRTEMERIEDVMEYHDDPIYESKKADEEVDSYSKLSGNVEIKNLTFGYSRLAEPLIKDFSMTMKPGSRIAFVGGSGCGKSTLAKLISGLYQPWSGEILFDGKKHNEIDRNVFTGSVAVVDQDIILFEDSIRDNIKMWDNSIEDFEMIMAARDAQIHEDIMQREGGYDHKLIEGGRNLSGGQRQRMEIARVLAQDPTIIIMDEATSALDAKTEYEVVKAIKDRGITCIVIAHRLSTIRDSDEIIVLDHGKVVERGTHEELYGKGGYYTELVTAE